MKAFLPCLWTILAMAGQSEAAAQGLPSGSPIKPALEPRPPHPVSVARSETNARQPATRSTSVYTEQDSFYDRGNPAFEQLQKAEQSLGGMPVDRAGFIDWMNLLNEGRIVPRANVSGDRPMVALDLDILLKNTRQMPWVRFPHRGHTMWLDCSNCHPVPFAQKTGTARITMEAIFRGQWCGLCHDKVAFITHLSCERCHSIPNADPVQSE